MFPQRLKELRKRSGFSQKSLSVQLGVSQQAVAARLKTIRKKIKKALNE